MSVTRKLSGNEASFFYVVFVVAFSILILLLLFYVGNQMIRMTNYIMIESQNMIQIPFPRPLVHIIVFKSIFYEIYFYCFSNSL